MTLLGALERQRANLLWKCEGLDRDGLRTTLNPSTITLGGLLKHLARTEDSMFSERLLGHDPAHVWREAMGSGQDRMWGVTDADTPESLIALWSGAVQRSRSAVAAALSQGGMGHLAVVERAEGLARSVRRTLIDMIEEYARHVGHADLIRESIDGLTGWRKP